MSGAGVALFYRAALALLGAAFWQLRPDPLALLGAAARWRSTSPGRSLTLDDPADGASALARFRANRNAGLLMFARLPRSSGQTL